MYYLITYNSITYATRVKNYFAKKRGYIGVIHTPSELSRGGCSYSIKVKQEMVREILEVSNYMGFTVKGIYRQKTDGTYVEAEV